MGYLRRVIADSRPISSGAPRRAAVVPAFPGHPGAEGLAEGHAVRAPVPDAPLAGPADRRPPAATPGLHDTPVGVEDKPLDVPLPADHTARAHAAPAPARGLTDAAPPASQPSPPPSVAAVDPADVPPAPATAGRVSRPLPPAGEPPRPASDGRSPTPPAAPGPAIAAQEIAPGPTVAAGATDPVMPLADRSESSGTEPPRGAAALPSAALPSLPAAGAARDLAPTAAPLSALALDRPPSSASPAPTAQIAAPPVPMAPAAAYGVTSRRDDPAPRPVRAERAVPEAPPEVRIGRVEVFVEGPPASAPPAPSAPPRDNSSRYRLRSL